ncbi:MAG: SEC-C metal-binding domain-containing protein [Planctomycetota bacterium]
MGHDEPASPNSGTHERIDASPFLASTHSTELVEVASADQRVIVERFLSASYDVLGKAPRFLDGQDLHHIIGHILPTRFSRRDRLADAALPVLRAYLTYLDETEVVTESFEQRQSLESTWPEFITTVATGENPHHGHHHHQHAPTKPITNRAEKVGRNDPCPCGSGRKFKQCCAKLGF